MSREFILPNGQRLTYTDKDMAEYTWTEPCGCLMSAGEDGDFCLVECSRHQRAREFDLLLKAALQ